MRTLNIDSQFDINNVTVILVYSDDTATSIYAHADIPITKNTETLDQVCATLKRTTREEPLIMIQLSKYYQNKNISINFSNKIKQINIYTAGKNMSAKKQYNFYQCHEGCKAKNLKEAINNITDISIVALGAKQINLNTSNSQDIVFNTNSASLVKLREIPPKIVKNKIISSHISLIPAMCSKKKKLKVSFNPSAMMADEHVAQSLYILRTKGKKKENIPSTITATTKHASTIYSNNPKEQIEFEGECTEYCAKVLLTENPRFEVELPKEQNKTSRKSLYNEEDIKSLFNSIYNLIKKENPNTPEKTIKLISQIIFCDLVKLNEINLQKRTIVSSTPPKAMQIILKNLDKINIRAQNRAVSGFPFMKKMCVKAAESRKKQSEYNIGVSKFLNDHRIKKNIIDQKPFKEGYNCLQQSISNICNDTLSLFQTPNQVAYAA